MMYDTGGATAFELIVKIDVAGPVVKTGQAARIVGFRDGLSLRLGWTQGQLFGRIGVWAEVFQAVNSVTENYREPPLPAGYSEWLSALSQAWSPARAPSHDALPHPYQA